MRKIIALTICTVIIAVMLSGCVSVVFSPILGSGLSGSGSPESYTWDVGSFTDVRVDIHCDIKYYSAPSDTVTLEIQPNLREYIEVEVSGGVLTVRATRSISTSGRAPVLTISTPVLNSLSISGAGVFTAFDTITTESFSLNIFGAGSGKADFDVSELKVNMSGAGAFELSGRADNAEYSMSGAGTIEAFSLQSRDASVNLSGVGSVRLSCSDNLRINAGGMGTVEYRGSPNVDLSRGGMVTVRNVS